MNSTKRLMFGLISSLLLAAGFARAADRFDPMSQNAGLHTGDVIVYDGGSPPPTPPCSGGDNGNH